MSVRGRIVVADDSRDIRDLVRGSLLRGGYEVEAVTNGREALARVATREPDLLVLDINMPELDGFAVLQDLQQRKVKVPVLVLTARHVVDDVMRAHRLGARDYLSKPFCEAQLQARVARLLRKPRSDRTSVEPFD